MHNAISANVIDAYIKQIGIEHTYWQNQAMAFYFEHLGTLHFEVVKSGLLVALAREVDAFHLAPVFRCALKVVHLNQQLPITVQTGLRGENNLVFFTVLSNEQQSLGELNEAIDLLGYLHKKASEIA